MVLAHARSGDRMTRLAVAALLLAATFTASAAPATAGQPPAGGEAAPPASAEATPADDGTPVTCTGTLSGAVKGQFTCRVTVSIEGDVATFKVEPLGAVPGVRTLVPADFQLAMPLRAQAYGREAVQGGSAVVELASGDRYTASGRRGEVALTLESAERYRQAQRFYVVSGTLRVHLVADGAAQGEVVMDLRF
jgi:hypothetical protein